MTGKPFFHVALPVLDELEYLPALLECLSAQSYSHFRLIVCVNQPESWWEDPHRRPAIQSNLSTLQLLRDWNAFPVEIIDRTSRGQGWSQREQGVGWARKLAMDAAAGGAATTDIMLSLDADTTFPPDYFRSVADSFSRSNEAVALAVPYFHKPPADPSAYRAILRYEIYMRHYFLNLLRIGSPYAFTALGSAMACTAEAYSAVGGMNPKRGGEDFYFLQKLRKYGKIMLWNDCCVYPAARFSDRVAFGTGPAMIKGNSGDWSSYPIYAFESFNEILETNLLFPLFFAGTLNTKVTRFIAETSGDEDPWMALRSNHKNIDRFIRACHEKFDGLRILQYLKTGNGSNTLTDEARLRIWFDRFYRRVGAHEPDLSWDEFSFTTSDTSVLEQIRMFLFEKEMEARFNSEPV